jgi:Zn-dependent protease
MRDPFTWSFPIGTLSRITIRVHVLFPLVAAGLILRVAFPKEGTSQPGIWVEAVVVMVVLFISVLLHEFGHCFAARAVDGDAHEVLLWPLGGLAALDVPHTPKAHFIATAGGPAVNLLLCLLTAVILVALHFEPPVSPWWSPYAPKLTNFRDHLHYGSKYDPGDTRWQAPQGPDGQLVPVPADAVEVKADGTFLKGHPGVKVENRGTADLGWLGLVARFFWINWVLFWFNLILVAYPMDSGRLLQAVLWPRLGYRQAMLWTIGIGFVFMLGMVIWAIVSDSVLLLCLAIFIYVASKQQWLVLETGGEESLFGYDFSQGYTSLERDRPPPAPRRPNFFQRWLQKRAQRKMQREQEQREAEERRMDELLEKVQQQGLQALTDEERRFLQRVSAKYRNRN